MFFLRKFLPIFTCLNHHDIFTFRDLCQMLCASYFSKLGSKLTQDVCFPKTLSFCCENYKGKPPFGYVRSLQPTNVLRFTEHQSNHSMTEIPLRVFHQNHGGLRVLGSGGIRRHVYENDEVPPFCEQIIAELQNQNQILPTLIFRPFKNQT